MLKKFLKLLIVDKSDDKITTTDKSVNENKEKSTKNM